LEVLGALLALLQQGKEYTLLSLQRGQGMFLTADGAFELSALFFALLEPAAAAFLQALELLSELGECVGAAGKSLVVSVVMPKEGPDVVTQRRTFQLRGGHPAGVEALDELTLAFPEGVPASSERGQLGAHALERVFQALQLSVRQGNGAF
jgi:hypothetical protein